MSSSIKEEIELLKTQITNEIYSLRLYEELSYVCDSLLEQMESYPHDDDNEYSLKKYKAYLQVFLEYIIGYINNLIANKVNGSIFDNRTKDLHAEIKELEDEINALLDYINENFPTLGEEVRKEYKEIKDYYDDLLTYTKGSSQRRFDTDILLKGDKTDYIAKEDPSYEEEEETPNVEPILSIYSDTAEAARNYVNRLRAFKLTSVDSMKVFVDNDKKIKELFKNAYDNLSNPVVITSIKQMEQNYIDKVNECMEKGHTFASTTLLKVQESMIGNGLQIDGFIQREKEYNRIHDMIFNMTVGFTSVNDLSEIIEYVSKNHVFEEELCRVLYFLVEKSKYEKLRFGVEPVIYNSLDDHYKLLMQKMFLDRLSLFGKEEREEVIINMKKNGYLNTMDIGYEHLLSSLACDDTTFYSVHQVEYEKKDELDKCFDNRHYSVPVLDLCKDGRAIRRITIPNHCGSRLIGDWIRYGNIYKYTYEGTDKKGERTMYLYFDKDGNPIKKIPNNAEVVGYYYGKYIINNYKGNRQCIVDENFKVVKLPENPTRKDMLFDRKRKRLVSLTSGNGYLRVENNYFERKGNVLTVGIEVEGQKQFNVYFNERNSFANGGVVPLFVDTKINGCSTRVLAYYDVESEREICHFNCGYYPESVYGYNEGLLNFVGKNGLEGYMDRKGNVVIEPQFKKTQPFHQGLAYVTTADKVEGFIDHKGVFVKKGSIINGDSVYEKVDKDRYEYYDSKEGWRYYITTSKGKRIDGEDKTLEMLNAKPYLNIPSLDKEESVLKMN